MEHADIKLYFPIPIFYESGEKYDQDHRDCQHSISVNREGNPPKKQEKIKIGSKKLLFLHGSKKEWIDARNKSFRSIDEESGSFVKEVVDEVLNELWDGNTNDNHYKGRSVETSLNFGDDFHFHSDILHLLLVKGRILKINKNIKMISLCTFSGCYDHIVEKILLNLDWTSLQCLLSIDCSWRSVLIEYWRSSRQTFLLTSHWRSFVPSQKEIKWDTEVSAMFCCLSYVYCGFINGGLVKYSRHDQTQIFFIIAHPNSSVIQLDATEDLLATAGSDKVIKVWSNNDGQLLCQIFQAGPCTDIKILNLM